MKADRAYYPLDSNSNSISATIFSNKTFLFSENIMKHIRNWFFGWWKAPNRVFSEFLATQWKASDDGCAEREPPLINLLAHIHIRMHATQCHVLNWINRNYDCNSGSFSSPHHWLSTAQSISFRQSMNWLWLIKINHFPVFHWHKNRTEHNKLPRYKQKHFTIMKWKH